MAHTTAADLAAQFGLRQVGARPPLRDYIRQLWSRRHFIQVLGTPRRMHPNQNNYLGQLWAVLNPMLSAAAYLFVFGFLLQTTRGVRHRGLLSFWRAEERYGRD